MSTESELLFKIIRNGDAGALGILGKMTQTAQRLATLWGEGASSISPVWRIITMEAGGGTGSYVGFGTSTAASLQGLAALGIAGVSIAVAAGVYVALGAGYYEARERTRQRGYMRGFSRGFVAGMLNWQWPVVWDRLRIRVAYMNVADSVAGRQEAAAENEALFVGYCLAWPAPEGKKKQYRKALRALAGRRDDGAWSSNQDVARNQQIDYVASLAGAGLRSGLIVAE